MYNDRSWSLERLRKRRFLERELHGLLFEHESHELNEFFIEHGLHELNEYFIEHGLLGCNGYTTLKASPLNNRRSFRPAVPMLYQWHSEGVLHLPAHLTLFGRPFQGRAVSSGAVSRGCSAPTVIERQPLRGLARLLGSGCLGVGILRFNLSRLRAVSFTERESPDGTTDCIVML